MRVCQCGPWLCHCMLTLSSPLLLPQNDSLRKFYTSLKQQRPNSEMATK